MGAIAHKLSLLLLLLLPSATLLRPWNSTNILDLILRASMFGEPPRCYCAYSASQGTIPGGTFRQRCLTSKSLRKEYAMRRSIGRYGGSHVARVGRIQVSNMMQHVLAAVMSAVRYVCSCHRSPMQPNVDHQWRGGFRRALAEYIFS